MPCLLQHMDAYSAFYDNGRLAKTALDDILKGKKITTVFISGLAFDFCVAWSAKDATELGYTVYVIEDATAGIAPDTVEMERQAMLDAGVTIIQSGDIAGILASMDDDEDGPSASPPPGGSSSGGIRAAGLLSWASALSAVASLMLHL